MIKQTHYYGMNLKRYRDPHDNSTVQPITYSKAKKNKSMTKPK